jgi:CheY-like chemotaxis protein
MLAAKAIEPMHDAHNLQRGAAARRTILLAEDEFLIRMAAAEALRETGFVVMEAASAEEAMTLIASGLVPDVLFTDVRMGGLRDGLDLAERLRRQIPRLLVIIASAHADSDNVLRLSARFFSKPYDISAVARTIKAELEKE